MRNISRRKKSQASKGWFNRFKARSSLHNTTVRGEKANANTPPAKLEKNDRR